MKGHYFLKWLFLTVLSVSTLHFRESSNIGQYRIEQISSNQNIGKKSALAFSYFKKSSDVRTASFVFFKNAQYKRFTCLSNSLSAAISRYPQLRLPQVPGTLHIQNQHFRSRTLASDEHSISQS